MSSNDFREEIIFDTIYKIKPITKNASELYKEEISSGSIITYQNAIDELLINIIKPKLVTELTGLSGTGKTQICFQLCASVQLPKSLEGLEGQALYISTNRNFASHRLKECAVKFVAHYNKLRGKRTRKNDIDVDFIMKNIFFIKLVTAAELLACLQELETFLEDKEIRLVVIDSISYPLRTIDCNVRTYVINHIFLRLRQLSTQFNFAVVVTNDMTIRMNELNSFTTPSLGDTFYHLVNSRILLKKHDERFSARIEKSPQCNGKEVYFYF